MWHLVAMVFDSLEVSVRRKLQNNNDLRVTTMNNKILNEKEKAILDAIRENPELEKCFLEMIEITHERLPELERGDDAEDAVVNAIQKTGKALLQEWAEKQKNRIDEKTREDRSLRPHGKKSKLANIIGKTRDP
jgi:hypothetical protein